MAIGGTPESVPRRSLLVVDIDGVLKVAAIERLAADRPLAWIDDILTPGAWAKTRPAPTLLLPVDPATGLAGTHVARLLAWAYEAVAEGAGR